MRRPRSDLVLVSPVLVTSVLLLAGCPGATQADSPRVGPPESGAATSRTSGTLDAPSVSYVSGTVLHHPDGSRLQLDLRMPGRWGITSIVPVADGYLVTDDRWFEGTLGMHRLDADGVAVDSWASTGPALLGPDGQVAWARVPVPEGLQTVQPSIHVDDRAQELPGQHQPHLLQFDGALVVYSARILPGPGRSTFQTSVPGTPRPVARPVERTLSPGRRHWWQWNADSLELGRESSVLVRWEGSELFSTLEEPVWEDERHLLVTVVQGGSQALVRLGTDGSATRATPWVPATVAGHAVMTGTSGRGATGD